MSAGFASPIAFGGNDGSKETTRQFRELALEYQRFASDAGVRAIPFGDPALPLFEALSEQGKRQAVNSLAVAVRICRNANAQGVAMEDTAALLWQALKEFGLRPPSDLFGRMEPSTVVEIYSPLNIQLFRSFNFFRYCSYTLEELHCREWVSLFAREREEVVGLIMNFVIGVFTGKLTGAVPLYDIPRHRVHEVSSQDRFILETQFTWGGPLYLNGTQEIGAVIGFQNIELVGRAQPFAPGPEKAAPPLHLA